MGILTRYKNGNYQVTILDDGTKIRENDLDFFDADRPESIDLTVTYKCGMGCPYCYQGCTKGGTTCDFDDPIVDTFPEGLEVAIGASGGVFGDNVHKFESFLKRLKDKKCIPNITVNQYHFIKNKLIIKKWISENLVYGVGVSISSDLKNFNGLSKVMQEFLKDGLNNNIVIHTIAGIHTVEHFKTISGIYKTKDKKPKVLILGYKNIGRGENYGDSFGEIIKNNIDDIKQNIVPIGASLFEVLSFDNPAIDQLELKKTVPKEVWDIHYLGDDGTSTFYVDLVKQTFSVSSLSTETFSMKDFNDINSMFMHVKNIKKERENKNN